MGIPEHRQQLVAGQAFDRAAVILDGGTNLVDRAECGFVECVRLVLSGVDRGDLGEQHRCGLEELARARLSGRARAVGGPDEVWILAQDRLLELT